MVFRVQMVSLVLMGLKVHLERVELQVLEVYVVIQAQGR